MCSSDLTRLTSAGEAELNSYCKVGSYYAPVMAATISGNTSTQRRITFGSGYLSSGQLSYSTGFSTTEFVAVTLGVTGPPTEYLSVYGSTIYSSNASSGSFVEWMAIGY